MVTPKRLIDGSALSASAVVYYTAPDRVRQEPTASLASPEKARTYIRKLTLTNTSAVDDTVTIYLVPVAGTAGVTNAIISAKTIPAGTTVIVKEAEGHVLEPGGTIQALKGGAGGSAITIMGSGIEIR